MSLGKHFRANGIILEKSDDMTMIKARSTRRIPMTEPWGADALLRVGDGPAGRPSGLCASVKDFPPAEGPSPRPETRFAFAVRQRGIAQVGHTTG